MQSAPLSILAKSTEADDRADRRQRKHKRAEDAVKHTMPTRLIGHRIRNEGTGGEKGHTDDCEHHGSGLRRRSFSEFGSDAARKQQKEGTDTTKLAR